MKQDGPMTTITRDEHLAHVAAQQAVKGLIWDERRGEWVERKPVTWIAQLIPGYGQADTDPFA